MGSAPIRILHVMGGMNRGGAETMVMNLYRSIDRERVQFDFVVHATEKCSYDDEILELGGNIYRYPRYKGVNHVLFLNFWNSFFREHSEFICIHCHIRSVAVPILKQARKHGHKTISHSHSTSSGEGIVKLVKDYYQKPLKREGFSDLKIACSQNAGEWLFGQSNFMVLNNAISTEKFMFNQKKRDSMRQRLNLSNQFVLGNISRFNEVKNHMFLLDIFHEVRKKNENAMLLLVGDGSLRLQIEEKIKRLGLEDAVILTGVASNPEDYLQAMDVFLFPSLFEGLPVTLIEAQASGIPCVISDKVISKEVRITDLVEFISLEESAGTWATHILTYQDGYERSGRKEEIVKAGYDVEETAKMLEDVYLQFKR